MHSRWRSKSNTLNSMEREMGRCPTRKHASKKRPILFLNTNGVAFNPVVKIGILYIVQVAWFGHMTRVMPQNHRHLQPFGGLLRILHSGEFKKFLGKPLKYAPFVILSVLAVRTNQSPGVFLVGNNSPNVKPAHWKMLPAADFFVRTGRGRWSEYPRGIVGWDGMMGLIWLGYNFGRWRSLLVSVCWEARVVERSIFGRQSWIKSDRKQL